VVTQTIAAEGDGVWHEYAGGYSDWAAYQQKRQAAEAEVAKAQAREEKAAAPKEEKGAKAKPVKLSYKETKELEALPDRIAGLEAEQAGISQRLEDPGLYQRDPQEAQRLSARLAEIDEELLVLLERWEELEGKTAA